MLSAFCSQFALAAPREATDPRTLSVLTFSVRPQIMRDLSEEAIKRTTAEVYFRYLFPHLPLANLPPPGPLEGLEAPMRPSRQAHAAGPFASPPQQRRARGAAAAGGASGSGAGAGASASKAARTGTPDEARKLQLSRCELLYTRSPGLARKVGRL